MRSVIIGYYGAALRIDRVPELYPEYILKNPVAAVYLAVAHVGGHDGSVVEPLGAVVRVAKVLHGERSIRFNRFSQR